ncbi:hypothetical protein FFRU_250060 [Fructobacillus fructosus]|uniref:hypothetical protein n=1 Tax=Fructobacillus fructosus TaxID=1631 RepID=UPI0002195A50|nr:hypothetical protein [Fructobacillus fructosus]KRN52169.1 hypothetical protein IV71_GL001433 [Fructobacillus fructosus KCTC 3544]GAP02016.1 hypothetical protein FFRU_250060 [Fructobacillus fructosus]
MNVDELDQYIKSNCRAYNIFIEKAREEQNDKNSRRQPKKRFNSEKVERESQKMWEAVIANLHSNLQSDKSLKRGAAIRWIAFMNENNILESFEDSMGELELSE